MNHTNIELYRRAISGLLFIFAARIVLELFSSIYIGVAVSVIVLGIILAKSTAKHFGHHHQHTGDSALDAVPLIVLFLANILHPAIDGFSMIETFRIGGIVAGVLLLISIIVHEILRQSAFISALSTFHIQWKWVVSTAVMGMALGVATALYGTDFFERYEIVADLATLFSYSFVIAEFYFIEEHKKLKYKNTLFAVGSMVGIVIVLISKVH